MADFSVPFLIHGITHLLITTKTLVKNRKEFSADANTLRMRFEAGNHRVQCCVTFLYGHPPSPEGGIYIHLTEETKEICLKMLLKLFLKLKKYQEIEETYGLATEGTSSRESAPFVIEEFLENLMMGDPVMTDADADAVQVPPVDPDGKWWKKTKWAISGKNKLESLVVSIEEWNAERIAGSTEAKELQFAASAKIRALILGGVLEEYQILPISPEVREQTRVVHNTKSGMLEGRPVLFEFKSYELDNNGMIPKTTEAQISSLISLLSQQIEAGSRVLSCRQGFTDPVESRFVFAYDIPPGKLPQPITLTSVLDPSLRYVRPSITVRLKLGHCLAESLYLLHTVGWVHKNLNGDSVLFFKHKEPSGDGANSRSIYDTPYIIGFGYSRPESGSTSNRSEWRIEKNIYRHWERWGEPTARSSKIHDIYALGVLLLEIGLWKSARSTSRDGFTSHENDPTYVQDSLRKMLCGKLAFAMGEKYENLVRLCLEGSGKEFGAGDGGDTDATLYKVFREKVVEVLKTLSEAVWGSISINFVSNLSLMINIQAVLWNV